MLYNGTIMGVGKYNNTTSVGGTVVTYTAAFVYQTVAQQCHGIVSNLRFGSPNPYSMRV